MKLHSFASCNQKAQSYLSSAPGNWPYHCLFSNALLMETNRPLSLFLLLQHDRESRRERVLEADTSTAPPGSASQGCLPRLPSLRTSQQLPIRNEPPPVPAGPRLKSPPSPRDDSADTAATASDLLIHPRQAARAGSAFRAVFEAMTRLLPPFANGKAQSESPCDGGAGARSRVETMQMAAIRCGVQCQGCIRALLEGIQVQTPS